MRIMCVFGRHNYGDPRRGDSPEYTSFMPALANLGHDVRHFESWDRSAYATMADLNQALLDAVEDFRPDLIFTVQMLTELWIETLDILKARGDVATLSWATDDSWKYREASRFIGPSYHAMATTYDYVIPQYHADGIREVIRTQWAAPSTWLHPPVPAAHCRYDVSFVGMAHGDRTKMVERLAQHGIHVTCFGHGWASGSVAAADIPGIVANSKISLNFANSKTQNQIKARTFEVPGAGGFLLTEDAQGLEDFYVPGQEIAVYAGFDDLVAKITHYLAHPALRDAIAQAGHARTKAEHTYEHRLKALIDFALAAKARAPASPSIGSLQDAKQRHRLSPGLRGLRWLLVTAGTALFGKVRGPRAARRLVFELSWRLAGRHTFTAAGWTGRMFPHD